MSGSFPMVFVLLALSGSNGCTCGGADDAGEAGSDAADEASWDVEEVGPEDGETREVEAWFERFDVRECDDEDWEAGEVTAPQEVPAGVDRLSLKWAFVPFLDPGFRERGRWGRLDLWGPLAERLDGGVCMILGAPDLVGCVTREGEFAWNYGQFGIEIVGGPTVLPDGLILVVHKFGTIHVIHPDGREHGFHEMGVGLGQLADYGEWRWGPAAAPGGFLFFATFGSTMPAPDVVIREPRDILLVNARCPLLFPVWRWNEVDSWGPIEQNGGVIGDRLVLAVVNTPLEDDREVVAIGVDGVLQRLGRLPDQDVMIADPDRVVALRENWEYSGSSEPSGASVDLCALSILSGVTECVRLRRALPYLQPVIAGDGSLVATRSNSGADSLEAPDMVGVWERDGTLRWRHDWPLVVGCETCSDVWPPVVGRDGSVLVTRAVVRREVDGSHVRVMVVHLFTPEGRLADSLEMEGYTRNMRSYSPLLARDGTLYLAVSKLWYEEGGWMELRGALLAIQTPVPGPAPEDPGWPIHGRRTTRGDLWMR